MYCSDARCCSSSDAGSLLLFAELHNFFCQHSSLDRQGLPGWLHVSLTSQPLPLVNKDLKKDKTQHLPHGTPFIIGFQLDLMLLNSNALGLAIQPIFSPPHSLFIQPILQQVLVGGSVKSLSDV